MTERKCMGMIQPDVPLEGHPRVNCPNAATKERDFQGTPIYLCDRCYAFGEK